MSINSKSVQHGLAAIVGVTILGANLGAAAIKASGGPPRLPITHPFPIVFHSKDAKTGLDIRTTQTRLDEIVVDVKDASVAIRKQVGAGTSVTTLTTKSGVVTMRLNAGVFTVKTAEGQVTGNLADRDSLAPVHAALGKSAAAQLARSLLARMTLNPDSVPGHALLLTRALLQSVLGDRTGADSLATWSKQQTGRARVRRIAVDDGPEYCWDTYAISAIKIWDEYADCYGGCTWYNLLCKGECAFIYDLRAEGAFAWWLKCTAIRT